MSMYHWQDSWKQTATFIVHVIIQHTWKCQQSEPLSGPPAKSSSEKREAQLAMVNSSRRLLLKIVCFKKIIDTFVVKTDDNRWPCVAKNMLNGACCASSRFALHPQSSKAFCKAASFTRWYSTLTMCKHVSSPRKTMHIIPAMHKKQDMTHTKHRQHLYTHVHKYVVCPIIRQAEKLRNAETHH